MLKPGQLRSQLSADRPQAPDTVRSQMDRHRDLFAIATISLITGLGIVGAF
jgi:hypothetical protein